MIRYTINFAELKGKKETVCIAYWIARIQKNYWICVACNNGVYLVHKHYYCRQQRLSFNWSISVAYNKGFKSTITIRVSFVAYGKGSKSQGHSFYLNTKHNSNWETNDSNNISLISLMYYTYYIAFISLRNQMLCNIG